jgi:hypothetical protein
VRTPLLPQLAFLAATLLAVAPAPARDPEADGRGAGGGGGVTARVDPRVELLSIVFRLAGSPEYGQGKVPSYVVTFDRPMRDQAWAVVGGGPNFPKVTGPPSYDAARRVLTVPVELQPDWSYELWLNRGRFDSFQSEEGVKLPSVHVTFRTRGG